MIIVIFGEKATGKSTLAMGLEKRFQNTHNIDSDEYSMINRIENSTREFMVNYYVKAIDIGNYLYRQGMCDNLVYSMSFEVFEAREYLREIMPEAHFFYLYHGSKNETNMLKEFDTPSKKEATYIDTHQLSIDQSLQKIVQAIATNTYHTNKNF